MQVHLRRPFSMYAVDISIDIYRYILQHLYLHEGEASKAAFNQSSKDMKAER